MGRRSFVIYAVSIAPVPWLALMWAALMRLRLMALASEKTFFCLFLPLCVAVLELVWLRWR